MIDSLKRHRWFLLLAMLALSLFLRLDNLGAAGFSEDEVHKLVAGRSYLRGQFLVNLEHPMVMKALVALSLAACDRWNARVSPNLQVSEEASVRLPNAVFGALTSIVIYLIADEMFGLAVGLVASLLWSTGILAITINRVAKEDSLLVFFTWLAFYLYMRAKRMGGLNNRRQKLWYLLAGASFGLMLASKYFPHYFGLNMLYYHVVGRNEKNQPLGNSRNLVLGALGLTFLIANPLVLSPHVLKYIIGYIREDDDPSRLLHDGSFVPQ